MVGWKFVCLHSLLILSKINTFIIVPWTIVGPTAAPREHDPFIQDKCRTQNAKNPGIRIFPRDYSIWKWRFTSFSKHTPFANLYAHPPQLLYSSVVSWSASWKMNGRSGVVNGEEYFWGMKRSRVALRLIARSDWNRNPFLILGWWMEPSFPLYRANPFLWIITTIAKKEVERHLQSHLFIVLRLLPVFHSPDHHHSSFAVN